MLINPNRIGVKYSFITSYICLTKVVLLLCEHGHFSQILTSHSWPPPKKKLGLICNSKMIWSGCRCAGQRSLPVCPLFFHLCRSYQGDKAKDKVFINNATMTLNLRRCFSIFLEASINSARMVFTLNLFFCFAIFVKAIKVTKQRTFCP